MRRRADTGHTMRSGNKQGAAATSNGRYVLLTKSYSRGGGGCSPQASARGGRAGAQKAGLAESNSREWALCYTFRCGQTIPEGFLFFNAGSCSPHLPQGSMRKPCPCTHHKCMECRAQVRAANTRQESEGHCGRGCFIIHASPRVAADPLCGGATKQRTGRCSTARPRPGPEAANAQAKKQKVKSQNENTVLLFFKSVHTPP